MLDRPPLSRRFLTFMMARPVAGDTEQLLARMVGHYGGVLHMMDGDIGCAVFGHGDEKQDEQGLAACLAAQSLQAAAACHTAVHADIVDVPPKNDLWPVVLQSAAIRSVRALCDMAEKGETLLSVAAHHAIKNQVMAREVQVRANQNGETTDAFVLRKIIDRNAPLFYMRHALGQALPMFGRESEFEQAVSCANVAFVHGAQHMHVEGDAGSGKTRLVNAVIDQLLDEHGNMTIVSCPSGRITRHVVNPVQEFVCDVCTLQDHVYTTRARISDAFIQLGLTNDLFVSAYLDAHGLPGAGNTWKQMPEADRQFFQAELGARLLAMASKTVPVAIIFDDIHKGWGHKQALVQALRNNFEKSRLFVFSVSKRPDLFKGAHCKMLRLNALDGDHIRKIVTSILPRNTMLVDEITARAGGNPYFAIQLAQHVDKDIRTSRMPADLDSLFARQMANMDGKTRDILACCAVLGQKFFVRALCDMLSVSAGAVETSLRILQEQGLLHLSGEPLETYEFTHDLAQESIYRTLSDDQRRDLHGRAYRALRHLQARGLMDRHARMAHHAFHGEIFSMAYACGFAAGLIDLDRGIPSHAEESLSMALIAIRRMQTNADPGRHYARTLLYLAKALSLCGKPRESLEALSRISAQENDDIFQQQKIQVELSIKWTLADYTHDEILDIESRINHKSRLGIGNALRCAGILSDLGYFAESNARIDDIFPRLHAMNGDDHYGLLFPAVSFCHALQSRNHAEQGDFEQARSSGAAALDSVDSQFPPRKVYALAFSSVQYQRQGQHDKALPLLKEAYFIAREYRIGMIYPFVACNYAHALYFTSRFLDYTKRP